MDSPVLIVGGGPVGLTLALELDRLGVRSVLVERNPAPRVPPKMERCNARTMELYHRLGVADPIRRAGLDEDGPMDVIVTTRCTEPPLARLAYPTVREARARSHANNDGSHPREPYQIVSQYTLEPILKAAAEARPLADIRFSHTLIDFEQDADGVTANIEGPHGRLTVNAAWMVGCDGGRSTVRKQLGIALQGKGGIRELRQALIHAPGALDRLEHGDARHFHLCDALGTSLIVQDDRQHISMHTRAPEDADMAGLFREALGVPDAPSEVRWIGSWKHHLLVAERLRDRRVFLAGDAIHLVIPTGGLGMNTGVGDAVDLAWKLAGTVHGWGGPALLDSYEPSRGAIARRNVDAAGYAAAGIGAWRSQYTPILRDDTPDGAAARARIAAIANREQRRCHEMSGIELGYGYPESPLVCPDDGVAPDFDAKTYTPSTFPGARLPHVWLEDGRSTLDLLGPGFTLLSTDRFDGGPDGGSALVDALIARGVPVVRATAPGEAVAAVYEAGLLLVRPDGHVAWRSNEEPASAVAIAERVAGW